jgi:hypothetical protein
MTNIIERNKCVGSLLKKVTPVVGSRMLCQVYPSWGRFFWWKHGNRLQYRGFEWSWIPLSLRTVDWYSNADFHRTWSHLQEGLHLTHNMCLSTPRTILLSFHVTCFTACVRCGFRGDRLPSFDRERPFTRSARRRPKRRRSSTGHHHH